MTRPLFTTLFRLLGKAGADQLDQAINSSLLIGTISNDADGGAANDFKST